MRRTAFHAAGDTTFRLERAVISPGVRPAEAGDPDGPTLEQETLAAFITSGLYERHLRRVRRRNAAARRALLGAIQKHLSDKVQVTGEGAGAHVVLWLNGRAGEAEVINAAAAQGVRVYGISGYCMQPARPGIILGYARLSEPDIREGIRRLAKVL